MRPWATYIQERSPIGVYTLLSGGIAFGSIFSFLASSVNLNPVSYTTFIVPFAWSFVGILLFFMELRLMDEKKDYSKDLMAHPTRPLPRGLIAVAQVATVINGGALVMLCFSLVTAIIFGKYAGGGYLVVTAYLWLMYKEFFVGGFLQKYQLLYALSHQVIMLPLGAFPASTLLETGNLGGMQAVILYSISVLGAFFSYEVGRKLDPAAHPILQTYRLLYGEFGCLMIVLVASSLTVVSSLELYKHTPVLWQILLGNLTLYLGSFLGLKHRTHKISETLATLFLLLAIYAPLGQFFLNQQK